MKRSFFDQDVITSQAYRKLTASLKSIYFYIWSKSDKCGVYISDPDYFKVDTGEKFSVELLKKLEPLCLIQISETKFFFTNFILVQYGELKESYNPHKPVFRALREHDLLEKHLKNSFSSSGIACHKLEEEEEDKEEDKEEEEGKEEKGVVGGKKEKDEFWARWTKAWDDHVKNQTEAGPVWSGKTTSGLKNIREYFLRQENPRTGQKNSENEALECFVFILSSWNKLDSFKQGKFDTAYMASNISDYISNIKNPKPNVRGPQSKKSGNSGANQVVTDNSKYDIPPDL